MLLTRAAPGVAVGLLALSCSSPKPCLGAKVGDRFTVTVVDTYGSGYDAGSSTMCGFGFDVAKGTTLTATAVSSTLDKIDDCTVAAVEIAPFNGWTWTLDSSMPYEVNNDILFGGAYTATNGTCTGTTTFAVYLNDVGADPFGTYTPGQEPKVFMGRGFVPAGAGCPNGCDSVGSGGAFVVNVKRL